MLIGRQYVSEIQVTLDQLPWQEIERIVDILYSAWLADKQVFIMGNGGSASTASHMACDIGKNTAAPGVPRLRAMSLNDNMALFSAHANDNGYENVFAEQLRNFLNPEDVVLAISASGNSPNVLRAIDYAHTTGATTIGWSGHEGGKLAALVDFPVVIRNDIIEQIEDIHIILVHIVTSALRQRMQEQGALHGQLDVVVESHSESESTVVSPNGRNSNGRNSVNAPREEDARCAD